jgi:hypothetical protein
MPKSLILLLLFPLFSLSQTLTGTVKDSLGNPLQNANVIAKPLVEKQGLKFAIADHLGRYKLELEKDVPYEVRFSYLGFTEEVLNLQVVNKIELNTKYLTDDYIKELEEVIKKYTNEN